MLIALCLCLLLVAPAAAQDDDPTEEPTASATEEITEEAASDITFGMVLVGPRDDGGWSQAHYDGGVYVEETLGAEMLLHDSYAVRAEEEPLEDVIAEMVADGAEVIFMTSADFAADTNELAAQYPDVVFVQVAGDAVLTGIAPPNVSNIMGQMEWSKFVMGCAGALATETGRLGYLGPLIDSETRRLAASTYLGARHCYQTYRDADPDDLDFRVEWVGYWFYIPDQTRNPRRLVFSMFNDGIDVVLSGLDTPTAAAVAAEFREEGERVYAGVYDSTAPCEDYAEVCIGASFYNWGLSYVDVVQSVADDTWTPAWEWVPPDWDHFTVDTDTPVGFVMGDAFPAARRADLEDFIFDLEDYTRNQFVPVSFPLWQGLLRLQDGTVFAEDEELVNVLDVWYLPQLLQGMEGESYQFELEEHMGG
jgi:simple sugar transport system substrate-binding protein